MDSQRLQRLVQYFSAQTELLNEMRTQVESEITPLVDLFGHQRQTVDQLLENLELQLRPLNEYAATEESNLQLPEQRLGGEQSEFVLSQFQTYLGQQRQRIEETHQRISDQRDPLVAYADHQQDAVEVVLSRFDADVDALEQKLSEQRKVMMRMLDAMRSESFTVVRGFLADRESELSDAATSGETHPGKLGEQLANLGGAIRGSSDQHVSEVVAASDRADETLKRAAPSGPRSIVPPSADDDAAVAEADEEARTSA